MRTVLVLAGAILGALMTASVFGTVGVQPSVVAVPAPSARRAPVAVAPGNWAALRRTACDGPPLGLQTRIPASASIGRFAGEPAQLLRTLQRRDHLAALANDLNLTGRAAELGVWRGEFAESLLKVWRGQQYVLVDLWTPTDCVNGNRSHCVYGGNVSDGGAAERSFE